MWPHYSWTLQSPLEQTGCLVNKQLSHCARDEQALAVWKQPVPHQACRQPWDLPSFELARQLICRWSAYDLADKAMCTVLNAFLIQLCGTIVFVINKAHFSVPQLAQPLLFDGRGSFNGRDTKKKQRIQWKLIAVIPRTWIPQMNLVMGFDM